MTTAQTAMAAAQTAMATAQTAMATAQTTMATAKTAIATAQTAMATAQTAMATAQTAMATAQTAKATAQTATATAQTAMATAQTAIATAQTASSCQHTYLHVPTCHFLSSKYLANSNLPCAFRDRGFFTESGSAVRTLQQTAVVQYVPSYLHKRWTSDYPHFWLFSAVDSLRSARQISACPSSTLLLCQLPHNCSAIKTTTDMLGTAVTRSDHDTLCSIAHSKKLTQHKYN
jgi:multidrug efflux pump subunit AcrA (membrane-fusion protein)